MNEINHEIILNDKEYNDYLDNTSLVTFNTYGKEKKISKKFLLDLFNDHYEDIFEFIKKSTGVGINWKYIDKDNKEKVGSYTKVDIMNALNAVSNELPEGILKFALVVFNAFVNEQACLNKYTYDFNYNISIDNKEIEVNTKDYIKILLTKDDIIEEINKKSKRLNLKQSEIAYILRDFVEREMIFDNYLLSEHTYENYKKIVNYKKIDFENINSIKNNINIDIESIKLNRSLLNFINSNLSKTAGPLEKIIHYYVRLCEALTIDSNYYASKSEIEQIGKHKNINYISKITPYYNEVVSYEFILIMAKLIDNLGIEYSLNLNSLAGYSKESSSLKFKYNEYTIELNGMNDLLQSDLTNAKIGLPLKGIKCINKNEITIKKFNEKLYKIYKDEKELEKKSREFRKNLDEYKILYSNLELNTKDKLRIFIKTICRNSLRGIDSISYINLMYNNIINDPNININILSKKDSKHKIYRPIILISVFNDDEYDYIIINNNSKKIAEIISRDELENKINSGQLFQLDEKEIPGLYIKENIKHVK